MLPGRILVLDLIPAYTSLPYLIAQGFTKETQGRRRGKYTHTFPGGQIAHAVMWEMKDKMEEANILCHVEFTDKVYPWCTMLCSTKYHPEHTEECQRRSKRKVLTCGGK